MKPVPCGTNPLSVSLPTSAFSSTRMSFPISFHALQSRTRRARRLWQPSIRQPDGRACGPETVARMAKPLGMPQWSAKLPKAPLVYALNLEIRDDGDRLADPRADLANGQDHNNNKNRDQRIVRGERRPILVLHELAERRAPRPSTRASLRRRAPCPRFAREAHFIGLRKPTAHRPQLCTLTHHSGRRSRNSVVRGPCTAPDGHQEAFRPGSLRLSAADGSTGSVFQLRRPYTSMQA